jgi:hypothetical protein
MSLERLANSIGTADGVRSWIPTSDRRPELQGRRTLPAARRPGTVNVGLDLPWRSSKAPGRSSTAPRRSSCTETGWSRSSSTPRPGATTDPRTFLVEKFTTTPHAPAGPLGANDRSTLSRSVGADLETQASLGASAYLLPGVIPANQRDDVHAMTLTLLETAQAALPDARPCVALLGVHTSSMEAARQLIDDLPHWIDSIYLQLSPVNPLSDSPSKIIDALMLMRHATQQGFSVIAGRLAGPAPLLRAAGIAGADAGLGEGESFAYGAKIKNHEPRNETEHHEGRRRGQGVDRRTVEGDDRHRRRRRVPSPRGGMSRCPPGQTVLVTLAPMTPVAGAKGSAGRLYADPWGRKPPPAHRAPRSVLLGTLATLLPGISSCLSALPIVALDGVIRASSPARPGKGNTAAKIRATLRFDAGGPGCPKGRDGRRHWR